MKQSNSDNYLDKEKEYFNTIQDYFTNSTDDFAEKMHAFCRFTPRQSIAYFMAREEIYKKILHIHGNIMDFGIYRGSSFFTWLQISSILEPYNHTRRFVGFDSFEGFSEISKEDNPDQKIALKEQGGMQNPLGNIELTQGLELLNLNRPLGHIKNSSIIKGNLPDTFQNYLSLHEESTIALANFGLGLYKPTKEILLSLKPRLLKGSILVFEELNQSNWPGETKALFEVFDPKEIYLRRFEYAPHISYFIYGES